MMIKNMWKTLRLIAFCGAIMTVTPFSSYAEENTYSGPGLENGGYVAIISANSVNIQKNMNFDEVLQKADRGTVYDVAEDMGNGWVKVAINDTYGYLSVAGNATISAAGEEADEIAASEQEAAMQAAAEAATGRRQQVVDYALQFVGGRYQYGGNDPHSGVDCSGFTRYVMLHGAGVSLNRSSRAQASQGVPVSSAQMRPGDLIFYGNRGGINHVAMYIGNGQIVHASTYKTGIKISNWNYRTPVKIINVLGD